MPQDPYMTPGSAVADQLQAILARKALEARQSQKDALDAQNVQSQIAARQSQAEETKSRIEALNANRQSQETQRLASLYSPGQQMVGSDLDYFQKNAPSLIDPGQAAHPNWDYEGQEDTPATGPTFHGLPVQIEKKRLDDEKLAALRVLNGPDFDKLPPIKKAQVFHTATGGTLPEAYTNPTDKDQWAPVYTAEGEDTGNWAPKTAHFLTREPREPRTPAPHVVAIQPATQEDPNKPGQFIPVPGHTTEFFSDGSQKDVVGNLSNLRRPGANPPPAPKGATQVGIMDAKAYKGFTDIFKNRKANPAAVPSARMAAAQTIYDPHVRADVVEILGSPELSVKSLQELATGITPPPGVDQETYVTSVLNALRQLGKQN